MTDNEMFSVLFFTPYGEWLVHNQVDVTAAAAMQARHCLIRFVTCDGVYQPCAITRAKQDCSRCQTAMAETLSPFGFTSSPLSSFMTPDEAMRADAYGGDVKWLRGSERTLRRRVGSWRILFEVHQEARSVAILGVKRRTSTTY